MTVNKKISDSQQRSHAIWTLFDYLLSEMGGSVHEKDLLHEQRLPPGNLTERLTETASSLGLNVSEWMLSLDQAVTASGNLTPFIKQLANGDWLVLSGFRRGRIKVALINDTETEVRLLKLRELAALLETVSDRLLDWYCVALKAPMDASANHHDEDDMPPLKRLFSICIIRYPNCRLLAPARRRALSGV